MTESLLALLLGVSAINASAQTLILDSKVSTEKVVTVGGKVYVPLSALPFLGIQVSSGSGVLSLSSGKAVVSAPSSGAGGANQKASVEGCINEWLLNGVWQIRVIKVAPVKDGPEGYSDGWDVTVEIRNGSAQTLRLDSSGVGYNGAINRAFADGDSWAKSIRAGWQDKTYAKLPQGSGFLYTFKLFSEEKLDTAVLARAPQKFLLENLKKIDDGLKGVGFTVPDPSFRVDLTCKK